MRHRVLQRLLSLLATLVLAIGSVWALTDEEVFRDLRFNLINPGARSLALGGAFISLADDATAAQANPAGLSFLLRPEYFVELRSIDNAARASIVQEQLPAGIDTFVATGTDLDDVVSPSFASAVMTYGRWAMGVSRQELLNISNSTLSTFRFTFGPDTPGAFLAQGSGSIDLEVTNLNVSIGGRITDRFGIGGTFTLSTIDVRSEVINQVVDTGPFFADTQILQPTLDLRTTIDDDDDDVVGSLGIIYKSKRPNKWSIGAVYRKGASFTVLQRIDPEQVVDGQLQGIDLFGVRDDYLGTVFQNRFSLPDSFGVGGHWVTVEEKLTLALNIERIRYSNLLERYIPGANILTSPSATFEIDDATDYRFGAEYLLLSNNLPPIALRAGAFGESDTTIEATRTGTDDDPGFATEAVFEGRGREYHGTVGVGIAWKRFTVDFAADFSESRNEYLISVIHRGK